ncbi:L-histidine N(alpha)-methyltransferase [Telmatospirillum sp. J64-1]|uniref:L-histidine N(alpha)-methyltransferase n=1 Tax=Telmatospirillum sp. J64-1 TaxID=2502183 RepID=UPI00115DEA3A|nr:L-histidine N(alpha)-methyltransferase [Telmatospirillum sp. J64-1]
MKHQKAHHDLLEEFRKAVVTGLSAPRKEVSCKFLYDERGSALFERICELEEYYPTRTEMGLLQHYSRDIARRMGPGCRLVEFGSGSTRKVRILLEALERPACYLPVDISREHLLAQARLLAFDYPDLAVLPICADFTQSFALPRLESGAGATLGFFPGSTIGNFTPAQARDFLSRTARLLGPKGAMLVGVDLRKAPEILHAAYDDREGVTAEFNLNLLARINRELDGDFDLAAFRHRARWNDEDSRVEMHLESRHGQTARACGHDFSFAAGETIHTENSYKYSVEGFRRLAREAGFATEKTYVDDAGLFSLHLLRPV